VLSGNKVLLVVDADAFSLAVNRIISLKGGVLKVSGKGRWNFTLTYQEVGHIFGIKERIVDSNN